MVSPFDISKPTEAQRIQDGDFLETVKHDLRPGLLDELCNLYEGFSDMTAAKRVNRLVDANIPNHGKGDCLPIEYSNIRFYAYAGVELKDWADCCITPTGTWSYSDKQGRTIPDAIQTRVRMPLIDERVAENTYDADTSCFEHSVNHSDLRMYLYGETSDYSWGNKEPTGGKQLMWENIPKYAEMPIAYRVALVCLYVSRHVVALPSDITAFVLGATESLETQRFIYQPTTDRDGFDNGWVLRIRDVRPSQSFVLQIASYLCGVVAEEERRKSEFAKRMSEEDPHADEHYSLSSQFEPKPKRKARAANEETETIIAYIDSLRARGTTIGRGGLSWDDLAGQLAADTEINREGKNLRDSYRSYKKRHGGEGR